MGNLHSAYNNEPTLGCSFSDSPDGLDGVDDRVLLNTDCNHWTKAMYKQFHFPTPCVDVHSDGTLPYSSDHCYKLETSGSRRRLRQWRHETSRYTADMETSDDSTHAIHIRDTVTSHVVIIPLVNAANNVPELDYMVDPILEVLAYSADIVIISVRGKTKRTPNVVLFFDIKKEVDIGFYPIEVNVNNLNCTSVECCVSASGDTFIISVIENHYDEFEIHFHALRFSDDGPIQRLCNFRFQQTCWYEPEIQLFFVPSQEASSDRVIVMGEFPNGVTHCGRANCLLTYNLLSERVEQAIVIEDRLYPKSLTCSPDGQWFAVLCRKSSEQWSSNVDSYVVQLYSADCLTLRLEFSTAMSLHGYNLFSNCSRVVFSRNSQLLAVASSTWSECWNTGEFEVLMPSAEAEQTQFTVYRLPTPDLSLKHMCRDAILSTCNVTDVTQLPLPKAMWEYLQYQ